MNATDKKYILKKEITKLITPLMPKTINGFSIDWDVEMHSKDEKPNEVAVVVNAYIYSLYDERHEDTTEYGLKTTWKRKRSLIRRFDLDDSTERFVFRYDLNWTSDEEFDSESETGTYYIFKNAPKGKPQDIRMGIRNFVLDCVKTCVSQYSG